jgi:hypothetical protein
MDIQGSFSVLTCSPFLGHINTQAAVFMGLPFFAKASHGVSSGSNIALEQ